jgi:hypothetical protein
MFENPLPERPGKRRLFQTRQFLAQFDTLHHANHKTIDLHVMKVERKRAIPRRFRQVYQRCKTASGKAACPCSYARTLTTLNVCG